MRDAQPLHTPHKDHLPRKIKLNLDRNLKQQQKSSRKDSIDISTSSEVSEDNPVAEYTESSRKDSVDTSTFLEVYESNNVVDSTESFSTSLTPFNSPSSVHPSSSGITILSSTKSASTAEPPDLPINRFGCLQSDSEVTISLERELVVKHLQQLMFHTLSSADIDLQYKKLLAALVERVIEGFCNLPEERHWFTEIISRRSLTVFLSLIFWILVVSTTFLFSKFAQSSYSGSPPT